MLQRFRAVFPLLFVLVSVSVLGACGYASFGASGDTAAEVDATEEAPEAPAPTNQLTVSAMTAVSNGHEEDAVVLTVELAPEATGEVTFEAPSQGVISDLTATDDGYTATYHARGPAGQVTLQANLDGVPIEPAVTVDVQTASNGFYLHQNGVTIKCEDAGNGDTAEMALNGQDLVTYTKRDYAQLETLVKTDEDYVAAAQTCTSGITALNDQADPPSGLFETGGYSPFNEPIGHWDTSSVTTMDHVFVRANEFNQDIGDWDTSEVTTMVNMFNGATDFNQDIGEWDTGKVQTMKQAFSYTGSFDQDIGDWNTSAVTDLSYMFQDAEAFNQPIGGWNTGTVTNMSYTFNLATNFNQDLSGWNTGSVTKLDHMFWNAVAFDQDLSGWCVDQVVDSVFFDLDAGFAGDTPKHPDFGACP